MAGVVAGVVALVAGVLAEVTELPGAVLEAAEETDAELELALEDAPAEELLVLFKQLVSGPLLTVKGADWPVAPVLSRRVRPREVPGAWLTFQVKVVPCKLVNCSMG